jgi:hypothetical protein
LRQTLRTLAQRKELFATTKKDGYPAILLTNREIEPYNPYYNGSEEEQLPHRYVDSFDEMVRNSEFRYFRPKPAIGDTAPTAGGRTIKDAQPFTGMPH